MLLTARGLTGWALANIFVSAAFVWLASWTWLEPNLRGEEVGRGGDALIWMVAAAPVLAFAAVANMVWFALAAKAVRRDRAAWPIPHVVVVAALWIAVLVVDHFRGMGF